MTAAINHSLIFYSSQNSVNSGIEKSKIRVALDNSHPSIQRPSADPPMATTQPSPQQQQQPPSAQSNTPQSPNSSSAAPAQSSSAARTAPEQHQPANLPFSSLPQDQVVALLKTLGPSFYVSPPYLLSRPVYSSLLFEAQCRAHRRWPRPRDRRRGHVRAVDE